MKAENIPPLIIVEDNPDDSFWLKRELKKANFEWPVILFTDCQEAIRFLDTSTFLPVAIFLDIHLSGMSGIEFLQRIKESSSWKEIPVFVMDGSSSPKEIAECQELGVAGFLDKPVSADDLLKTVAPLLSNHRQAE